jgi:protein TonB
MPAKGPAAAAAPATAPASTTPKPNHKKRILLPFLIATIVVGIALFSGWWIKKRAQNHVRESQVTKVTSPVNAPAVPVSEAPASPQPAAINEVTNVAALTVPVPAKPKALQPQTREIVAGSAKNLIVESSAPALSLAIDTTISPSTIGSALSASSANVALKRQGVTHPPSVRVNPKPNYPPIARETGISGTVVLKVHLDQYGEPVKVEVISGHPALAMPTQDFVRSRWHFNPAVVDGHPVPSETEVRLNFRR